MGGILTPGRHLWFVAYLFAYCLLGLPLLIWPGRPAGRAFVARLDGWMARGLPLWLAFVPLGLSRYLLRRHPETHALFNDPKIFVSFALLFLYGHLLGRGDRVWQHLAARRRTYLILGAVLAVPVLTDWDLARGVPQVLAFLLTQAFAWSVLLAALGYARALVTGSRPWLRHAQELAYPFYIWHQTVIIVVAYLLLRLSMGPWTRFAVLAASSFLLTWALCEGVARVPVLRACFGMAPARCAARALTPAMA